MNMAISKLIFKNHGKKRKAGEIIARVGEEVLTKSLFDAIELNKKNKSAWLSSALIEAYTYN